jgi:WD40 repeat protein
LLSKILIHKNFRVFDFDLLDDNYIICGCSKNTIELFNIETKQFIKKVAGYFMDPLYLKIISIPNGTKYLIVKCDKNSKLEIFTISLKIRK